MEVTLTGIEGEKNLDSSLSWLPVGLLGVANTLLFKKTGRLEAAVLLHLVYNAVVFIHS